MHFLVHCHVFYPELWGELQNCILNLKPYSLELWVSLIQENLDLRSEILQSFPNAKIIILENRGYDIAPFIEVINQCDLDRSDFILKLHTKRNIYSLKHHINYRSVYGRRWRRMLLAFMASAKDLDATLTLSQNDPRIGTVWLETVIAGSITRNSIYMGIVPLLEPELKRLGIRTPERGFLSGTMFIARPEISSQFSIRLFFTPSQFKVIIVRIYHMPMK